jgi:hypothetical protein
MAAAEGKKKGFWKHAFALEKAEDFEATEEELKVLDAAAEKIAKHGLGMPAILFLESVRPMNFIGAQAMAFFEPIVRGIFSTWDGYTTFYKIMERRGSVECLIDRVDKMQNKRDDEAKALRAKAKEKKKAKKKA